MFSYYLRLAFKSIRRNIILSSLMIAAIGLGIGASMTTITVNYLMSANPIPHKSEQLFYVQLDNWSPFEPAEEPNEPPDQLTWIDATNLMKANKAFRQSAMATTGGVIEPSGQDDKPYMASIRLAFSDFFPMFDAPFLFGSSWNQGADENRDYVIVISKSTNDRVFGGENSVGKSLQVVGKRFTVVGVLDDWLLVPRFYDVTTGAFNETEEVFMPFYMKQELELNNGGNTNCWKSPEGEGFIAFLQSECVNYQMWVELRNNDEKQQYTDFLNNYVTQQKELGRFPRPLNNRLSDVMQWMENRQVVADDAQIMMWVSFMFLLVCLLNTIGLLLAKFSGKAAEIGLRRAVGASKTDLFLQHLVETACIGLAGGLLGLILACVGLQGIKSLYGEFIQNLVGLDITMMLMAIALAIVSSILAGMYPTWRACNIAPASQLKSQ
ncbi:ABC transporter permease [Aliiglaciecola sp. LCG003]|uniref:ABC transporter permease n=1 Tax=Aliiglaciecola sp. LCG003 TaxID=3053655 RepID=UPI0025746BBE|nr:ABC transporter permease [Aliiglaciecola sp. LCG003]WJG10914.1 ABC transporter permease [Aliiglaciecola sp. LCG003]